MTAEIVKSGGALAIRPEQTEWTPEQAAVLRQSGISDEVTAAELSGFLHLCQRTQLDPFSRQIYLIGRYDKREQRKVFTPQTGIDGYRVIAHRVVAERRENFGYEDTQWCDQSGRWRDVWLDQEPPAAARVTVVRNGHRFPAIALYREYVQTGNYGPQGLWGKMPAGQLAKCAEALALRKAFPHDLAGVYTAEEMAQADNPAPAEQQRPPQPAANAPRSGPEQKMAEDAAHTLDPNVVRELYRVGAAEQLLTAQVMTPLGTMALGDYLIDRGQQLSAAASQQPAASAEDDIPDAERAAALDELRAAASVVGLRPEDLEDGFATQYRHSTAEGTVEELRALTQVLTRGAA
ncbi:phage recombination protein Bet [Streptacidiphilus sp. MAP5-3]|uniref:phage recombination protein Bet n=1 Tax=unclassified Streptacidiphilus TaxID=2643834 RepID=UPI0035152C44